MNQATTPPPTTPQATGVDALLDRLIAPGYSRLGFALRRRHWRRDDPAPGAMRGRAVLVTGANSGLGKAAARQFALLGASVMMLVRNEERGAAAAGEIRAEVPDAQLELVLGDVSDLGSVRRCAAELRHRLDRLDVVVHNAGAMPTGRTESADGHELSVATHVLGPVLLTELLLPLLRGHEARVVLVASGGMYAQRLPVEDPEYLQGDYRGATAYARSKRMQVAILPFLAERWGAAGVAVHAMHPGWADTPGVAASLPLFRALTRPILRNDEQGVDTAVWLGATEPPPSSGLFWHDRAPRPLHYRRSTQESESDRERTWQWIREAAGLAEEAR